MGSTVVIGSAFVAQYPEGGGNFWVPLQYLLGLRALGHDAWWLEYLWTRGDPVRDRQCIDTFFRHVTALGVADRVVLGYFATGTREEPAGPPEYLGEGAAALATRRRDALLVNLAHSVTAPLRDGFGRTALFDLDPGTFQIWAREWDMGVGRHDAHVTIGMHLGAPDSPIPLHGVEWRRVWPAVHLPAWPVQEPTPGAAYTTVTQWWNNQYAYLDGETYDCNKRAGFLPILPLARRAGVPIELAANLHPNEFEDRRAIAEHGWTLVDPNRVAGSPEAFQHYVQRSRGEVSAAKPAYVKAKAGWISDRTICYLASGRPCIVEATGAEIHLPPCAGLRFFHTVDEAVDAVCTVEADYGAAAAAARRLATDVFASAVTIPRLLAAAGVA